MAKKYVKQVAEYSAASQTTDIASQILFTTDHAGFYRINAMIKMSGLNSANANISANTDAAIYSGSLVSCDCDPSFNSFVT